MEIIKILVLTPISLFVGWIALTVIDKNLKDKDMLKEFKNDKSLLIVALVIGIVIVSFLYRSCKSTDYYDPADYIHSTE